MAFEAKDQCEMRISGEIHLQLYLACSQLKNLQGVSKLAQ
jgi:hypothetical protein